jgi:hypothetical protein
MSADRQSRDLDLHATLRSAAAALSDLEQQGQDASTIDIRKVATALRLTLTALETGLGECRQAVPYSPMRPVRGTDGVVKWCCNHYPEHCS